MEISINIFGPNDLSLGDSVKFKKDPKIKGYVINVRERKSFWRKKRQLYVLIFQNNMQVIVLKILILKKRRINIYGNLLNKRWL